uniref:Major facilitator superfamily (MFS) profile domain-containing protein n=1 Tax=Anopheles epiroticus TaxID=199890 RepID=A0A182PPC3_9DIPT
MKSDPIGARPDENGNEEYENQMTMRIDELDASTKLVASLEHKAIPKNGTNKRPKLPKNRSQLGSDFVPPDGGWGWMVVLAAGCSNLCTFPVLQQFGLLFRDRMTELSISASEVTTIINTHSALTSIVGLANGPMFRRFTYRQVAVFGALLVGLAVSLTSLADSFLEYMITFAVLYGAGVGINTSANSLALNTYFKQKRRIATGFAWTLTGLGPIVAPHLVTLLHRHFTINGTVLLFGGFAMNAVAFALLYQPVQWHSKSHQSAGTSDPEEGALPATPAPSKRCSYCQSAQDPEAIPFNTLPIKRSSIQEQLAYDAVLDTGTPMLSRANDGWYSRSSLRSLYSSRHSLNASRYHSQRASINLGDAKGFITLPPKDDTIDECQTEHCPTVQAEHEPLRRPTEPTLPVGKPPAESKASVVESSQPANGSAPPEKDVLRQASKRLAQLVENAQPPGCTCSQTLAALLADSPVPEPPLTLAQRIIIFFDLDLLRDHIYINIMIGITIANFAELNFSILTPFVLADFGCTRDQIAMAMSVLGVTDICCRCLVPLVADHINWQNRTFFLVGVINMALGRVVLAHFHSYGVVLVIACWIGFNKGLRTVFMALAIPSHVPLDRLPGATGIHLLFAGFFYLIVGPVVGKFSQTSSWVPQNFFGTMFKSTLSRSLRRSHVH